MNKKTKPGRGSQVNVGLLQDISTDKLLNPGVRVTVKMLPAQEGGKKIKGKLVSQITPRAETGVYWGYTVRIANNLSQVFTQSPYKDGYVELLFLSQLLTYDNNIILTNQLCSLSGMI